MTAPYGRHARAGFGPSLPNRLGWFAMEAVSLLLFASLFLLGAAPKSAAAWIFFACWTAHYFNRSLVFPWRTRTQGKTMPLVIVAAAACFNLVNAGLNGLYLGSVAYPAAWIQDPRFLVGLALFLLGAALNLWADARLIALRRHSDAADYAVPRGGAFAWVSCPNHLGEIVEWAGFALMCWNLPALSFAVWTAANLVPRALSHHRWYRARFPDYPASRKAVLPLLL
ncbi:MAG TPA: DUF1295 domain-containing protein [Rhizomicrobium sp.]|nr:DUF1295 domain-containing protein [Rhizomicrobium sp.]